MILALSVLIVVVNLGLGHHTTIPAPDLVVNVPTIVIGVNPQFTMTAASGPQRSECGVGAMMTWANCLWTSSYLSVPNAGSGTGVYRLCPETNGTYTWSRVLPHNSTYANRIIHPGTNQMVIGPVVVEMDGTMHVLEELLTYRVGAMALDIKNPKEAVLMHGMDGYLWRVNLTSYHVTTLFTNLPEILGVPVEKGEQYHGKAAFSVFPDGGGAPYLLIGSNTEEESDFLRQSSGGRLALWDGSLDSNGSGWKVLLEDPVVEIEGRYNFGQMVFVSGWDDRSGILRVLDVGNPATPSYEPNWVTYRIPKASHAWSHLWTTEWNRIREFNTERYIMDMQGTFFELSPLGWAGSVWGVRPLGTHLRIIPDWTSFGGFTVFGDNQGGTIFDNSLLSNQASSGLYFGYEETVTEWGTPEGWGGPWVHDAVRANTPSDRFLMTAYNHKIAHFRVEDKNPFSQATLVNTVSITIQVDFLGYAGHGFGAEWSNYSTIDMKPGSYHAEIFPTGFSAHWIRFVTNNDANVTAYLTYTA